MSQEIVPIIIDMQKDFCAERFQFDSNEADMKKIEEVVKQAGNFLDEFEGRTVTIRTLHGEEYDTEPWDKKYNEDKPCEQGTEGAELMPPIKKNTDILVTKTGFDGFQGTNLDNILKSLEAEKVAIGGVMTNVCVEYTAQSAFNHGYQVTILDDLTASVYPNVKDETLLKIKNIFGEVKSSRKFLN